LKRGFLSFIQSKHAAQFSQKKHAAQLSVILFNRVQCWSAATAMSWRRAEPSRDVREQRNREMGYLGLLKQCDIFFF
jgi:hypothetical protein